MTAPQHKPAIRRSLKREGQRRPHAARQFRATARAHHRAVDGRLARQRIEIEAFPARDRRASSNPMLLPNAATEASGPSAPMSATGLPATSMPI
jgi:hypothetical protein